MHIQSIPMWHGSHDNYAYLIVDDGTKEAVVVDPAHPPEVLPVLQQLMRPTEEGGKGVTLKKILNTHHHSDHAGGNAEMLDHYKVPVIGGADCSKVTHTPADGETLTLGSQVRIKALYTPCHTQDSISYFVTDTKTGQSAVFTGDTLFHGGCGRFFEGDAAQMNTSLNQVLGSLPDETVVYPGHEYTAGNAKFAGMLLPDDEAVREFVEISRANSRTEGRFTIGDEKRHNLFMRVTDPAVRAATGKDDPVEVMDELRTLKNNS